MKNTLGHLRMSIVSSDNDKEVPEGLRGRLTKREKAVFDLVFSEDHYKRTVSTTGIAMKLGWSVQQVSQLKTSILQKAHQTKESERMMSEFKMKDFSVVLASGETVSEKAQRIHVDHGTLQGVDVEKGFLLWAYGNGAWRTVRETK